MHRLFAAFFLTLTLALTLSARGADWFQFRGPDGQGHSDAKLATEWGPNKNVTWRKELPGAGWSSPVVVGGKIYLTSAVPGDDGQSLRALCLDAKTGSIAWDVEVFKQDAKAPGIHKKNSHASPTPFVEGDKVYVHFGHMGTACLKAADGSKVWATQELKYNPVHGNGGSPIVVDVKGQEQLISAGSGVVMSLDAKSGKEIWRATYGSGYSVVPRPVYA